MFNITNLNRNFNVTFNSSKATPSLITKLNKPVSTRAWEFGEYSLFFLFIFGTIGNTLSLIVMRSRRMRSTNAALFVTCMAVSDTILLLTKFISNMVKMYKIPVYSFCIPLQLIAQAATFISVWLIIIISIERTTAVLYPLKVAIIFSKLRVKLIITAMAISFLILCSSQSFCTTSFIAAPYFCIIRGNPQGFCFNYYNYIFPWIKSALSSWLPSVLGTSLNIIIIVALFRASKNRKTITSKSCKTKSTSTDANNNEQSELRKESLLTDSSGANRLKTNQNNTGSNKEKQITIMLVTISVSFVVLTFPYSAYDLWRKIYISSKLKDRQILRYSMFLIDLNHSTNFIFYFLTAKRFRDELKRLFCGEKNNSQFSKHSIGNNNNNNNSINQNNHFKSSNNKNKLNMKLKLTNEPNLI